MKGFMCGVCGFVAIDGAAPEKCPVCGAPKKAFEEVDVKTAADPNNLTEPEKKHVPVIVVEKKCGLIPNCTDVHVKIGEITHPMLQEHHIRRVDFYVDRKYIARMMFTSEAVNPAACVHLKAGSGKISAVELCNLHGVWIKEIDL